MYSKLGGGGGGIGFLHCDEPMCILSWGVGGGGGE